MTSSPGDEHHYSARMEMPVDYVPRRVVSLVPSLTESLFMLDLGGRLVAITDDCIYPADKVKLLDRVGGSQKPDGQAILNLQPDLILLNADITHGDVIAALRAANIPCWVINPRTVFDVLNVLWNMMDLFDHPVMVPRVREIERAYDYTQGAARAKTPIRVFAPIRYNPWVTFNAETYPHDVLRVCGGENVFAAYEQPNRSDLYLTLDEVVAAQPDVVLLPNIPYALAEAERTVRALDIPAAHHARIHTLDFTLLTWPGTRVVYALRDLPPLLMGEEQKND